MHEVAVSVTGRSHQHFDIESSVGIDVVRQGKLFSLDTNCESFASQECDDACYVQEMFGKDPKKWKILISKLKEKIKTDTVNADIFTTIIESKFVYAFMNASFSYKLETT